MSSILHYSKFTKQKNFNHFSGNIEFVKNNNSTKNVTIKKIKNYLSRKKIKIIIN